MCMHVHVHRKHLQYIFFFIFCDVDLRLVCRGIYYDFKKVKEGVGGMGIVPTERLETELAMHEDDSIARFEEVLCGGRTSCSCVSGVTTIRNIAARNQDAPALKLSKNRTLDHPSEYAYQSISSTIWWARTDVKKGTRSHVEFQRYSRSSTLDRIQKAKNPFLVSDRSVTDVQYALTVTKTTFSCLWMNSRTPATS